MFPIKAPGNQFHLTFLPVESCVLRIPSSITNLFHRLTYLFRREVAVVNKAHVTHLFPFLTGFTSFHPDLHPEVFPFFLHCPEDTFHHQVENARALLPSLLDGPVKRNVRDPRLLEAIVILASNLPPQDCTSKLRSIVHFLRDRAQVQR